MTKKSGYKKSARVLGYDFGLTAQELNFIFKEEGLLKGDPGNYELTEKAKEFAEEKYYHRGNGGYSHYNRSWTTRSWDESVLNNIDLSVERKIKIRNAIARAKAKNKNDISSENEEHLEVLEENNSNSEDNNELNFVSDESKDDALVEAIAALLVLVAVVGIEKLLPKIKVYWNSNVAPRIDNSIDVLKEKIKNSVRGKHKKSRI